LIEEVADVWAIVLGYTLHASTRKIPKSWTTNTGLVEETTATVVIDETTHDTNPIGAATLTIRAAAIVTQLLTATISCTAEIGRTPIIIVVAAKHAHLIAATTGAEHTIIVRATTRDAFTVGIAHFFTRTITILTTTADTGIRVAQRTQLAVVIGETIYAHTLGGVTDTGIAITVVGAGGAAVTIDTTITFGAVGIGEAQHAGAILAKVWVALQVGWAITAIATTAHAAAFADEARIAVAVFGTGRTALAFPFALGGIDLTFTLTLGWVCITFPLGDRFTLAFGDFALALAFADHTWRWARTKEGRNNGKQTNQQSRHGNLLQGDHDGALSSP
jgi:hypothetical protein